MPRRIRLPAAEETRPRSEARPGRPRRRWRFSLYLAMWTLVGILFVGPTVIRHATEGSPVRWGEVASSFFSWYLWGLLFPLIWWLSRRWPFERRRWPAWLLVNVALGLSVSLIYVALQLILNAAILGGFSDSLAESVHGHFLTGIWYYLLVYFAIVAVIHTITYYERLRQHELSASRLEGQLAQANLQMLKMQLRPHFLFNTLNTVSALMHRDVDAADRVITRLSDLLRMALEKDERHLVRLDAELDFLNRYLAIEQIRFRDRLEVDVDVAPACLGAQVPRLILQPLVENAIRHGIAMRSAAGWLHISARRHGSRLVLMVADDGPGLHPDRPLRPGVGLANTQARLDQLYGSDFSFELIQPDEGGLQVLMEIPFEVEPRVGIR